ncbi:MAG: nuclear transport factor 2 family protein [Bacteroidota bacterium]
MKSKLLSVLIIIFYYTAQAQTNTAEAVVQKQLETYNTRDIDGFMALFNDNVQLYNQADGKLLADGKVAVRKLYSNLFEKSPKLHSELMNRMVLNNTVIDHERITGRMGNDEPIELIVIYELSELKIIKVTVIR